MAPESRLDDEPLVFTTQSCVPGRQERDENGEQQHAETATIAQTYSFLCASGCCSRMPIES